MNKLIFLLSILLYSLFFGDFSYVYGMELENHFLKHEKQEEFFKDSDKLIIFSYSKNKFNKSINCRIDEKKPILDDSVKINIEDYSGTNKDSQKLSFGEISQDVFRYKLLPFFDCKQLLNMRLVSKSNNEFIKNYIKRLDFSKFRTDLAIKSFLFSEACFDKHEQKMRLRLKNKVRKLLESIMERFKVKGSNNESDYDVFPIMIEGKNGYERMIFLSNNRLIKIDLDNLAIKYQEVDLDGGKKFVCDKIINFNEIIDDLLSNYESFSGKLRSLASSCLSSCNVGHFESCMLFFGVIMFFMLSALTIALVLQ